jgi:flagellar hook protein FlgE
MSLNSAMLAGVSGLVSNATAMGVISDNIANVNTTAFKRNRSDFTRMVNVQAVGQAYSAGGVSTQTRQLVTTQGNINNTSTTTDIAIQGQGFFVVSPKAGSFNAGNQPLFTRVGSFTPDARGNLVNQSGHYLHAWPVEDDGSVNAGPSDLTALKPINLSSIAGTVSPSDMATITGNLRSTTPVSAAAAAVPLGGAGAYAAGAAATNMASGAVRPDATWSFQVYDSQGTLRTFNVGLLKSATANQWHTEIWAAAPNVVETGAGLVNEQIAVGTLAFTPSGLLDVANSTPGLLNGFNIAAFDSGAPAAGTAKWHSTTGVAAQQFSVDIGQARAGGGVTQFDSATTVTATTTNGALFGDLASVEINNDGFITAIFNNGARKRLYQIPVATFVNPDGLKSEKGGAYTVTSNSGNFNLKIAGFGGSGTIASSALEASTVDLALEFSNMIVTQRAYSASSKIITTADEMLDELIRMKR